MTSTPPRTPRRWQTALLLLALAAYAAHVYLRDRTLRQWALEGEAFGSTYTVQLVTTTLHEADLEPLRAEIETCLGQINNAFSTWKPDSDLSRFDRDAGTAPFVADTGLVAATEIALEVSRLSGGAFDGTFHPLFALWGFGASEEHRIPSPEEAARVRALCGWTHLHTLAPATLQKDIAGLQYNLNAMAPGYAADRVADLLAARGFTNCYVDVGGEAIVRGGKGQGRPWRLGIEMPDFDAPHGGPLCAVVALTNGALATSGDNRNYFTGPDGEVLSHIFDPRIGRPATTHVASVSILFTNAAWADALATTLFVMGPDEGIPWLTNVPGAEAFFLVRDGDALRTNATPGFLAQVQPPAPPPH